MTKLTTTKRISRFSLELAGIVLAIVLFTAHQTKHVTPAQSPINGAVITLSVQCENRLGGGSPWLTNDNPGIARLQGQPSEACGE